MKALIGAVVVGLALATNAAAQTQTTAPVATPPVQAPPSRCSAAPTDLPTLPDGATANAAAMETANTAFTTWAEGRRTHLQCRRSEIEELRAALAARTDEFNAAAATFNTTVNGWQADVDEFNARQPRRRGR